RIGHSNSSSAARSASALASRRHKRVLRTDPKSVARPSEPRQSLLQTPQGGPSVFWGRRSCALLSQTTFRRRGRRTLSMSALVLPVMLESATVSEPAEPRPAPLPLAVTPFAVVRLAAPARSPLFLPTPFSSLTRAVAEMPSIALSCSLTPSTLTFVGNTTPCWLPKIAPGPVIFIFPAPVPEEFPLRMPMNAPDTEWEFIWSQAPFPM